ncbi:hypothetical protein R6Q59_036551, partial [Mikania micrantha]
MWDNDFCIGPGAVDSIRRLPQDPIEDTQTNKANTAPPRGLPNVERGGSMGGDSRSSGAVRTGAPVKALPIEAPKLSLANLNKMTCNFGAWALIGDGSYCQVYYAKLSDEQEAIIKKLDTSSSPEPDSDFTNQFSNFMIKRWLMFVAITGKKGVEGATPGPLLTWAQRAKIAYGAARGLEYLHEKVQPPIVHRDIRSSNILLFNDFQSKIADFNLSNPSDTAAHLHSTRVLGTFGYHAPEFAMTGQVSQKSDVYSLGVVLLELLTGRKPVDHTLPKGEQSLVTWATPRLSEDK